MGRAGADSPYDPKPKARMHNSQHVHQFSVAFEARSRTAFHSVAERVDNLSLRRADRLV